MLHQRQKMPDQSCKGSRAKTQDQIEYSRGSTQDNILVPKATRFDAAPVKELWLPKVSAGSTSSGAQPYQGSPNSPHHPPSRHLLNFGLLTYFVTLLLLARCRHQQRIRSLCGQIAPRFLGH